MVDVNHEMGNKVLQTMVLDQFQAKMAIAFYSGFIIHTSPFCAT
jgi:hypothetical protein